MVDPAVAALIPTRPAKTPVITIVASLSLFLGVVGALLMRRFGNTEERVWMSSKSSADVPAALPAVRCKVDARELFQAGRISGNISARR